MTSSTATSPAEAESGAARGASARFPAFSRLRRRLRRSFLIIPLAGIAAGWLLASTAVNLDELIYQLNDRIEGVDLTELWFLRAAQDFGASARTAAGTMSSAMLTFIGVVFSITLVALQMAAGQFSPRVLRIYAESWVAKSTLAVFLATFVYTLRMQKEYAATSDPDRAVVPFVGAPLAMLLLISSLVMFVCYVHATIRMMRVTHVMDRVVAESLELLKLRGHPPWGPAPRHRPPQAPPEDGVLLRYCGSPGVLQAVDMRRMVRLAERDRAVYWLIPKVGDYLGQRTPLLRVVGGRPPTEREAANSLDVGAERSTEQDVAFGLRQLVDIAVRALSASVNDPTTAVQALDRVQVLLTALSRQPLGSARYRSGGVLRLVEPLPDWPALVDLAFTEVLRCGAHDVQVTRRLSACLAELLELVPADRRPPLREHRALLERAVGEAAGGRAEEVEFALTPDRSGLG